ncbi:chemotaxis protein CheW [Candidatus Acidulodesulfobacterium sp. H_13]|uniref:chemotaxis protein CheW n=1 Tax=Candidatus Acidulodesulfobacterium sp. H_13 TaxID=3395470 RepID=UPI003AF91891
MDIAIKKTGDQKNSVVSSEIDEIVQLVTFKLGNEEFALDILKVQEINRIVEITKVPKAPDFVEGVINLRGRVIPIVDIRKKFHLSIKEATKDARVIVVNIMNKTIGLIVDSVSEVLRINSSTIQPPPPLIAGLDSDYIKGVGKLDERLIILLDIDKIFTTGEHRLIESIMK